MAIAESDVNHDYPHFKNIIQTLVLRDEGQHFKVPTGDGTRHLHFGCVDVIPNSGGIAFRFVGSESDASEGSIGVVPVMSEITDDAFRIFRDDDHSYKSVHGRFEYSGTKAVIADKIEAACSNASAEVVQRLFAFVFGKEAA